VFFFLFPLSLTKTVDNSHTHKDFGTKLFLILGGTHNSICTTMRAWSAERVVAESGVISLISFISFIALVLALWLVKRMSFKDKLFVIITGRPPAARTRLAEGLHSPLLHRTQTRTAGSQSACTCELWGRLACSRQSKGRGCPRGSG